MNTSQIRTRRTRTALTASLLVGLAAGAVAATSASASEAAAAVGMPTAPVPTSSILVQEPGFLSDADWKALPSAGSVSSLGTKVQGSWVGVAAPGGTEFSSLTWDAPGPLKVTPVQIARHNWGGLLRYNAGEGLYQPEVRGLATPGIYVQGFCPAPGADMDNVSAYVAVSIYTPIQRTPATSLIPAPLETVDIDLATLPCLGDLAAPLADGTVEGTTHPVTVSDGGRKLTVTLTEPKDTNSIAYEAGSARIRTADPDRFLEVAFSSMPVPVSLQR